MNSPARRIVAGPAARPVARPAGPPVRTRWDETSEPPAPVVLDDLGDVVAPASAVGVLARTVPGQPAQFRPASHHHAQDAPSAYWLIAHGLPFTPNVSITGEAGQHITPASVAHSPGQTVVAFSRPVAGTADLS